MTVTEKRSIDIYKDVKDALEKDPSLKEKLKVEHLKGCPKTRVEVYFLYPIDHSDERHLVVRCLECSAQTIDGRRRETAEDVY